jgi:hypothetical protein
VAAAADGGGGSDASPFSVSLFPSCLLIGWFSFRFPIPVC